MTSTTVKKLIKSELLSENYLVTELPKLLKSCQKKLPEITKKNIIKSLSKYLVLQKETNSITFDLSKKIPKSKVESNKKLFKKIKKKMKNTINQDPLVYHYPLNRSSAQESMEKKYYKNRTAFIKDTSINGTSLYSGMNRGCYIELVKQKDLKKSNKPSDGIKIILPPKFNMLPHEYDVWIVSVVENLNFETSPYYFHQHSVKYWRYQDLCETDYKSSDKNVYQYPVDSPYQVKEMTDLEYGPYGSQWVHDKNQTDDQLTDTIKERSKKFTLLRNIKLPDQRSKQWFQQRRGAITASAVSTILNDNKYEMGYSFIEKKVDEPIFQVNAPCYHGKKLEEPATMIYQYRMNVKVEEFGLLIHPKYPFIGASPDGICSPFKLDGKSKSKYVGRMLEIKCPVSRKIITTGKIAGGICPIYYYHQIQQQLECCDLDECDFWQCKILPYENREEFIADTNVKEPFRSKETGFEKGCLIELIPSSSIPLIKNGKKEVYNKDIHNKEIWGNTNFIYPTKIEMTPYECDIWVAKTLANLSKHPLIKKMKKKSPPVNYVFHKIKYWKLSSSHNITIKKDPKWISDNMENMKKTWNCVSYFRENEEIYKKWKSYIKEIFDSYSGKLNNPYYHKKNREVANKKIMEKAYQLCDQ